MNFFFSKLSQSPREIALCVILILATSKIEEIYNNHGFYGVVAVILVAYAVMHLIGVLYDLTIAAICYAFKRFGFFKIKGGHDDKF